METTFKISRINQYIDIKYVTPIKLPMMTNDNIFVNSAKEGRKFIQLVRDLENRIRTLLNEKEIDLDYRLIIVKHFRAIDSIASGFDVRSHMSIDELSERFVDGYKLKYDQVIAECEDIFDKFNEVKDNTSYMQNFREYDKFNQMVDEYKLDYPQINSDDFGKDELKNMSRLANEMLEILIKKRKENATNENTSNTSN
jgi:hypothetical protein